MSDRYCRAGTSDHELPWAMTFPITEGEAMVLQWSTESVPPTHRFEQWREACRQNVYALSPERRTHDPFQGSIAKRQMGALDVTDIVCEGHFVRRREQDIADCPGDTYCVYLQRQGQVWFEQQGQRCVAEPGDIILVDPQMSFSTGTDGAFDFRLWRIGRARLSPLLAIHSGQVPLRRLGRQGSSELIASWLNSLLNQCASLSPKGLELAFDSLCALVAEMAGIHPDRRECNRVAKRQALLHRIMSHVQRHASDPALTPSTVGGVFGVSVRTLHQLFTLTESSFHQFLIAKRLEHACTMLRDPALRHMDTASIGFAAGFGEVSTFYRRFKSQYGMAPGDWRNLSFEGDSQVVEICMIEGDT